MYFTVKGVGKFMIKTFFQIILFFYALLVSMIAVVLFIPFIFVDIFFPELTEPIKEFLNTATAEEEEMERE